MASNVLRSWERALVSASWRMDKTETLFRTTRELHMITKCIWVFRRAIDRLVLKCNAKEGNIRRRTKNRAQECPCHVIFAISWLCAAPMIPRRYFAANFEFPFNWFQIDAHSKNTKVPFSPRNAQSVGLWLYFSVACKYACININKIPWDPDEQLQVSHRIRGFNWPLSLFHMSTNHVFEYN